MSKTKNVEFDGDLVNPEVLEELEQSFETMEILDSINVIDKIRARVCDLEDMRQDFFSLHEQAHALINEGFTDASGKADYKIWELAEELEFDILDWIGDLEKIVSMLNKLTKLCPVEEYEDE